MKTIGPLHLEDLEPHRFEDLVRQLLYDFRTWAQIEAVGRSGSDHGFDVRAQEVSSLDDSQVDETDDELVELPTEITGKVWVIQCKREKSIGPTKLATYMDELPDVQEHGLYGLIFVAACDFSFAARDILRRMAREKGFTEAYLWGKGEIEDQLFQPKNDHLLFAYFGISLQTRKRSIATSTRAKLAIKRKLVRILEKQYVGNQILVRDASDDRYPHADGNQEPGKRMRGRWSLMQFEGAFAQGALFKLTDQFAYLADDQKSWDRMDSWNSASPSSHEDYWATLEEDLEPKTPHFDYWEVWSALPENNKASYVEYGIISYENIIDIDEKGDQYFDGPHLYIASYDTSIGPFKSGKFSNVKLERTWDNIVIRALPENRVIWFQNIQEQAEKIRAERESEESK